MREEVFEQEEERDDESDGWYEHHRIKADKGQRLLRVDKFLQIRLENVSRSKIQNAAKAGSIRVNGAPVKPNYKVKPEDEVTVLLSKPPSSKETLAEDIPLEIIYEDDDLMLVNKKAGMVVHPGLGVHSGTLVNAIMHHFTQINPVSDFENGLDPLRPGLVHRIDKNTSGLLVIAKSDFSLTKLCSQFFDHSIDRKYWALVWGDVAQESGTIEGNIGRDEKNRKLFKVYPTDSEIGKSAITHYKVLQRFGYVTLIECKLETGRTHQIRVHLKHIGHTLFNDPEYGGNRVLKGTKFAKYKQFVENCFSLIPGQALHAKTLEFEHPTIGKRVGFESPLPQGFQDILIKWERYIAGATNQEGMIEEAE